MSLQAYFLPSTLPVHKEGSTFLGIPLSENARTEFKPSVSRSTKSEYILGVRAQAAVTTPNISRATPEGKKTLRKGNVVITGASSGLGLAAAKALAETGKWNVVMACRDFLKAERAAKAAGMAKESYTVMHLDLASLDSVRQFVENFRRAGMPLDVLVCNAAETRTLWRGTCRRRPTWGPAGAGGGAERVNGSTMIDGGEFDGAKAYKDSKVCNMLTMQEFHRRFHEETGVTFASLYPAASPPPASSASTSRCSASCSLPSRSTSPRALCLRTRPAKDLLSEPSLTKSGVYWSWNKNSASFENQLSQEASDPEKAKRVWELSEKLVGLA
uniref:protochlorophyllide reductase n=1 Tax=Ananas comosus var. bracteatus TaxID=296719 RepID=A0A6V7PZS7_ANACO|nr:unnamed protein product [Ananas comosus var. bracteatus]